MRGARGGRRGRGRGRGRGGGGRGGRGKKSSKAVESDEDEMPTQSGEEGNDENDENQQPTSKSNDWGEQSQQLDLEADISLLEAPTFSTINRGPPEPMLRLRWDHRVNLMGEKVVDPVIHTCDKCLHPILLYGRMIPCRHIFCFVCAKSAKETDGTCPRCQDNVQRVEQASLGTVYMCLHGGTRNGSGGCRRTYLSMRDLLAHVNHRHSQSAAAPMAKEALSSQSQLTKISSTPSSHAHPPHHSSHVGASQQRIKHLNVAQSSDPRIQSVDVSHHRNSRAPSPPPPPPPPYGPIQHRPSMMVAPGYTTPVPPLRTNLITVPIQDVNATMPNLEMSSSSFHHHYSQPPPPQYTHTHTHPPYGVPPPQQTQYYPYVPQMVPQTVPQGVPPVPQSTPQGVPPPVQQTVPQGVPPPTALRPPQYADNQYRAPPPTHAPQWQHPTNNPPPTFYR